MNCLLLISFSEANSAEKQIAHILFKYTLLCLVFHDDVFLQVRNYVFNHLYKYTVRKKEEKEKEGGGVGWLATLRFCKESF